MNIGMPLERQCVILSLPLGKHICPWISVSRRLRSSGLPLAAPMHSGDTICSLKL